MRNLGLFIVILVLILVLFASICPATDSIDPDAALLGRKIRNISLSADRPLDRSHFDPYIGIKPGDLLTRTGIKKAVQFFYDSGRFSQVIVKAFPADDEVSLQFDLRCNYYFNAFSVEGHLGAKSRSLSEEISLPIGQRFTGQKLEVTQQAILKLLHDRGYFLAQVESRTEVDEESRRINTCFRIQPGELATIRSIDIAGVLPQEMEEVSDKLGYKKGEKYNRRNLSQRMSSLRRYFYNEGYLTAVSELSESFDSNNNTIGLALKASYFEKVRVVIEGFKIDRRQRRRLLPIMTGQGIDQETLQDGITNLRAHLEDKGYPEAEIAIQDTTDNSGVRVIRYVITPGYKITVAYVHFKGNQAIRDKELLASIESQPKRFLQKVAYSPTQLDDDTAALKSLYESRGYLQADIIPLVEPTKNAKRLGITFLCKEGPHSRTQSIQFHGNKTVNAEYLIQKLNLAVGKSYSPILVEQSRQAILAAYSDFGYLQTQVTYRASSPNADNSYSIDFEIQEGMQSHVDHILVFGNKRTRSSVINKRIKLHENEPLSLGKQLQTQQSLYSLGIFDQVRLIPQSSGTAMPYQDVVVSLQEAKRFTVRYGFGYQEREKLRGTVEFSDVNVFGTARRADLRLRGSSIEQQALFNLQQPQFRIMPVNSYLTLSASKKRDVSFDSRRFNFAYQFSHQFNDHSWGLLRYSFKNVRLSNLQVSTSELGREDTPRNLSTISVIYVNDTRDSYLDPGRGFFTSTDISVTTKLLGSNNYISFFSQNSYYTRLPKSLLMAASLRIGAAHPFGGDNDLPISERFFAGGSSSLRGFETDYAGPLDPLTHKPVGGNMLITGSLEIRIPLLSSIHLAGFYDTGNVFRKISQVSISDFSNTVGVGLRIKTPFGPLRADYGFNLNLSRDLRQMGHSPRNIYITIGPPF